MYLSYTKQSVNIVWGNNRCLFSDPRKTAVEVDTAAALIFTRDRYLDKVPSRRRLQNVGIYL